LHSSHGFVIVWSGDKAERITMFANVDEAHAAAERLVREQG
jgi:hypothetical protein